MATNRTRHVLITALASLVGGVVLSFVAVAGAFSLAPVGVFVEKFLYAPSFALGRWLYEHDFLGTLSRGDDMAGWLPVLLVMWLQNALMIALFIALIARLRRGRAHEKLPA